ncbi:MAG: caspase family protein [Acidobacteria bacterium]|nr:caspase family protein [Acidobacteriota bacterium]
MAKYGLVIGINDYPGTDSDLAGCVNDANDWKKLLEQRGFSVARLLNKEATGDAIRQAIGKLIAPAKSGDLVVVQYSGHGSFVPDLNGDEPDGVDECICPSDIVSEGVITDDELFQLYDAKAKGVKLVVISDSCHSGSVARFAPILTPPTMKGKSAPQRKVRFLPPAVFLARKQITPLGEVMRHRATSAPGRHAALLLSGCQDTEYSYDAWFEGRANGAFTYVAIQALARLSPKSTYNDWSKAIRAVLPSAQYPQSPNLFGTTTMKKWKVLE